MTTIRCLFLIIMLLTHLSAGFAQFFHNGLVTGPGSQSARSCLLLRDGGIAVLGAATRPSATDNDFLLIHFGPDGTMKWAKTYGGVNEDFGMRIIRSEGGGLLLMGNTKSFGVGKSDILLVNLDSKGSVRWTRTYGGLADEVGYSIRAVREGGYLIAGATTSWGSKGWAALLLRLNQNGDVMWCRLYDNWNTDVAADFAETAGGGFVVTGWAYSLGPGMHDAFVFKTDRSGSFLWGRIYGSKVDDGTNAICELRDGSYLVTGDTHQSVNGNTDALALHVGASGELQWAMALGGDGNDGCSGFVPESDTTIVMAGWLEENLTHDTNVWVGRLSVSGNFLYSEILRTPLQEKAFSLVRRAFNVYFLAGDAAQQPNGTPDVLLVGVALPPTREQRPISPPSVMLSLQTLEVTPDLRFVEVASLAAAVQEGGLSLVNAEYHSVIEPLMTMNEAGKTQIRNETRNIAPADSEQFILSEISRIAASKAGLEQQIPCDFAPVDEELKKAESVLRIGDFTHSLERVTAAESLLVNASCGPVTIEELKALGAHYDKKKVEITAAVVAKSPSTGGEGYALRLKDRTGEIDAFFGGTLRGIELNDEVAVSGRYSFESESLDVSSISKRSYIVSTGLLAAGVALLITFLILVYRLLRRRKAPDRQTA